MQLIMVISEQCDGDGCNSNCDVSHMLTYMHAIAKMATSSGAEISMFSHKS